MLVAYLSSAIQAATIIFVRHAERSTAINAAMTADAALSPAGEDRAKLLAQMLKDSGIRRVYVTEVTRTQQTAAPLAGMLRLTPVVIPQNDTDALVSALRKLGENETALVVGHTATLPRVIEKLGAGPVAAMPDAEYDRLVVVTTLPGGKARAVTLRYGKATQ
jgi:phosphohistidine phosphatase SixA